MDKKALTGFSLAVVVTLLTCQLNSANAAVMKIICTTVLDYLKRKFLDPNAQDVGAISGHIKLGGDNHGPPNLSITPCLRQLTKSLSRLDSKSKARCNCSELVINGRALHYVVRVDDRNASLKFYTDIMGMKILRNEEVMVKECKTEQPYQSKTVVGYGLEDNYFCLQLTYDCKNLVTGVKGNECIGITVIASQALKQARKLNWPIHSYNMLEAPDGLKMYVIDSPLPRKSDPIVKISLACTNLTCSLHFWHSMLGLTLFQHCKMEKRAQISFRSDEVLIELHQVDVNINRGQSADRIVFSCPLEQLQMIQSRVSQEFQGRVVIPLTKQMHDGLQFLILADPDGHEVCFVDDLRYRQISRLDPKVRNELDEKVCSDQEAVKSTVKTKETHTTSSYRRAPPSPSSIPIAIPGFCTNDLSNKTFERELLKSPTASSHDSFYSIVCDSKPSCKKGSDDKSESSMTMSGTSHKSGKSMSEKSVKKKRKNDKKTKSTKGSKKKKGLDLNKSESATSHLSFSTTHEGDLESIDEVPKKVHQTTQDLKTYSTEHAIAESIILNYLKGRDGSSRHCSNTEAQSIKTEVNCDDPCQTEGKLLRTHTFKNSSINPKTVLLNNPHTITNTQCEPKNVFGQSLVLAKPTKSFEECITVLLKSDQTGKANVSDNVVDGESKNIFKDNVRNLKVDQFSPLMVMPSLSTTGDQVKQSTLHPVVHLKEPKIEKKMPFTVKLPISTTAQIVLSSQHEVSTFLPGNIDPQSISTSNQRISCPLEFSHCLHETNQNYSATLSSLQHMPLINKPVSPEEIVTEIIHHISNLAQMNDAQEENLKKENVTSVLQHGTSQSQTPTNISPKGSQYGLQTQYPAPDVNVVTEQRESQESNLLGGISSKKNCRRNLSPRGSKNSSPKGYAGRGVILKIDGGSSTKKILPRDSLMKSNHSGNCKQNVICNSGAEAISSSYCTINSFKDRTNKIKDIEDIKEKSKEEEEMLTKEMARLLEMERKKDIEKKKELEKQEKKIELQRRQLEKERNMFEQERLKAVEKEMKKIEMEKQKLLEEKQKIEHEKQRDIEREKLLLRKERKRMQQELQRKKQNMEQEHQKTALEMENERQKQLEVDKERTRKKLIEATKPAEESVSRVDYVTVEATSFHSSQDEISENYNDSSTNNLTYKTITKLLENAVKKLGDSPTDNINESNENEKPKSVIKGLSKSQKKHVQMMRAQAKTSCKKICGTAKVNTQKIQISKVGSMTKTKRKGDLSSSSSSLHTSRTRQLAKQLRKISDSISERPSWKSSVRSSAVMLPTKIPMLHKRFHKSNKTILKMSPSDIIEDATKTCSGVANQDLLKESCNKAKKSTDTEIIEEGMDTKDNRCHSYVTSNTNEEINTVQDQCANKSLPKTFINEGTQDERSHVAKKIQDKLEQEKMCKNTSVESICERKPENPKGVKFMKHQEQSILDFLKELKKETVVKNDEGNNYSKVTREDIERKIIQEAMARVTSYNEIGVFHNISNIIAANIISTANIHEMLKKSSSSVPKSVNIKSSESNAMKLNNKLKTNPIDDLQARLKYLENKVPEIRINKRFSREDRKSLRSSSGVTHGISAKQKPRDYRAFKEYLQTGKYDKAPLSPSCSIYHEQVERAIRESMSGKRPPPRPRSLSPEQRIQNFLVRREETRRSATKSPVPSLNLCQRPSPTLYPQSSPRQSTKHSSRLPLRPSPEISSEKGSGKRLDIKQVLDSNRTTNQSDLFDVSNMTNLPSQTAQRTYTNADTCNSMQTLSKISGIGTELDIKYPETEFSRMSMGVMTEDKSTNEGKQVKISSYLQNKLDKIYRDVKGIDTYRENSTKASGSIERSSINSMNENVPRQTIQTRSYKPCNNMITSQNYSSSNDESLEHTPSASILSTRKRKDVNNLTSTQKNQEYRSPQNVPVQKSRTISLKTAPNPVPVPRIIKTEVEIPVKLFTRKVDSSSIKATEKSSQQMSQLSNCDRWIQALNQKTIEILKQSAHAVGNTKKDLVTDSTIALSCFKRKKSSVSSMENGDDYVDAKLRSFRAMLPRYKDSTQIARHINYFVSKGSPKRVEPKCVYQITPTASEYAEEEIRSVNFIDYPEIQKSGIVYKRCPPIHTVEQERGRMTKNRNIKFVHAEKNCHSPQRQPEAPTSELKNRLVVLQNQQPKSRKHSPYSHISAIRNLSPTNARHVYTDLRYNA